jgi:hypothetical protein
MLNEGGATMTTREDVKKKPEALSSEAAAPVKLARAVRALHMGLTGPDGLLERFSQTVIEWR